MSAPRVREIVVATTNPHKVEEILAVFRASGVEGVTLRTLRDIDGAKALPEPVEDAPTFEGNARLKALYYANALGRACLADDSGLEVDALGGAPGIYSARYAGVGATREERDNANNAKLLEALRGVAPQKRTARFVCAACLADPRGVLFETRGEFPGVIGDSPRGSNGFGYDPLLVLEDGRTSAELSPDEKNARSHRGEAMRALAGWLVGRGSRE
ncbi:MAG: RdgB/HAM1 family non-canonical purine NTP pyrophosphatase [Phycisphaeraceae bacterium]|nr:RdgB/HAM1 family non-canonical purine NTP pyrophosphatase [Phycisphaeraceae bacterium]